MKPEKTILQIPIENQIRELDAKLLLAIIAAKRGFTSVIGWREELKSRISSFPRSIYIAKDLLSGSRNMFKIMQKLGCKIVAWDEEGFVHNSPEIYYETNLSTESLKYVSHLFAWGLENAELWRQYPELPIGTPIHVTGNPRGDLLRPDMHVYYKKSAEDLRNTYKNFILINTNFTSVNAIIPAQNLFFPENQPVEKPKVARAARYMSREYAEGLRDHSHSIFTDFQRLIPALEQSFPDYTIVVRPHPTESHKIYNEIAVQCKQVRVTNEGNVIPWILASKAVIHNGCTTGVEAYVMGVPVVAYRATANEYYDNRFFRLPNLLSHQCFDFEELRVTLKSILTGELRAENGDERKAILDYHLAAQDGPLACERILDVLEKTLDGRSELPKPAFSDWLKGHYKATRRILKRRFKSTFQDSNDKSKFDRHRYPGISLEEVCTRVSLFQQLLGESRKLEVSQIGTHIFRITA
jgi:surface carbohydrate biosynthesis protein